MTYVEYVNTCQPSPLDSGNTTTYISNTVKVTNSASSVSLLVVSSLAIVLEVIALVVLSHPRGKRFGSMRKSLITLTSIEMWLNSTIFSHKAWEEYGATENETMTEFVCSFVLFSLLNNAICSRNWAVTLIALARCEVITRPVAHRVATHVFSPNRQIIYIVILMTVGMFLSVFRLLFRRIHICVNLGGIIRYPAYNLTTIEVVSEKIFFAYQSAIPIALVTMATVFMTIALLRHSPFAKRTSLCEPKTTAGRIIPRVRQKKQGHRLSKQVRATRAILLITCVFVVCEAPIFFAVVLASYINLAAKYTIYKLLRFLIVADTYANFVIYLLTSQPFRRELRHIILCTQPSPLPRQVDRGQSQRTSGQQQLSIFARHSTADVSSSGAFGNGSSSYSRRDINLPMLRTTIRA